MAQIFRTTVRSFATTSSRQNAIKTVTVIGGGLMGSGIAQVAATTGHQVVMVDQTDDILGKSKASIQKSLQRVVKKKFAEDPKGGEQFVSDILGRITTQTDSNAAVANSDLVIEAIVENIDVKKKLFSSLDKAAPQ
ncbi:3-hydroxyacyl-CoA dehydrogenase [Mytilus galloprovincialis]|nr:3-hydroxyacyl-CoA dehydrogenase [Mytilus galloprovincialis]